jgi:hypothetical protein
MSIVSLRLPVHYAGVKPVLCLRFAPSRSSPTSTVRCDATHIPHVTHVVWRGLVLRSPTLRKPNTSCQVGSRSGCKISEPHMYTILSSRTILSVVGTLTNMNNPLPISGRSRDLGHVRNDRFDGLLNVLIAPRSVVDCCDLNEYNY